MRKLFYLPLEPYKARYTCQLSRAGDGWFERELRRLDVDYVRVEGSPLNDSQEIKTGTVLDAAGRSHWSLTQMANLVTLIDRGEVTTEDVVYLEDFWAPGFAALPYIRQQCPNKFSIYALCHAQSVDTYDFTYPMRHWMRYFEQGITQCLDGIFVTNTILKEYLEAAMLEPRRGIFLTGLPYNSEEVLETAGQYDGPKERMVVFSSRWDVEKNPDFFLAVMKQVIQRDPTVQFVVTTSHPEMKSNEKYLLDFLRHAQVTFPQNLTVAFGLTKQEYYRYLQRAKVQFNCASQDFTSWTLLEATTFGCYPCYPNWRSFPEVFGKHHSRHLYTYLDVNSAVDKVWDLLGRADGIDVSWIYEPYNHSTERMISVMRNKPMKSLLFPHTPETYFGD